MAGQGTFFRSRVSAALLIQIAAFAALIALSLQVAWPANATTDLVVDCDFPGGNIVVDSIDGTTVSLHQDLRDTQGDWFYWYFRVRGAAGRTLHFRFTKSNVIGVLGPAVSTDGGKSWQWLGAEAVDGQTFRYAFPPDAGDVRFSFGMPYVEANLNAFLARFARNPHLRRGVLCRSRKGRPVELLHLGRLDGPPDHRAVLTCRHHACEMMANYTLEGIIEAVLADGDDGRWLREHVEFLVVPFMDKDGVEDGDQGKNRIPHDHNRDYDGESIYPSVRALKQLVQTWARGRLRFALDMHCPYIRGPMNEWVYLVGGPDQENWRRVGEFSKILEEVQTGPIRYRAEHNLPHGKAWNTLTGPPKSCSRWMAELPGIRIGTSIEIPYANANGEAVTPETARALGRDLARALRRYLEANE